MEMRENEEADGVVRIALGWLVGGAVAVVLLSVFGGWLAVRLWQPRPLLTSEGGQQLVSTVQEITISPSKASGQVASEAERSVVLIGRQVGPEVTIDRTGVVVTSDGLLVTVADEFSGTLVAYDWRGTELTTEFIGVDELFGLAFLRITDGVLPTLDLRPEALDLGGELLVAGKNEQTFQPRVSLFETRELRLPPELAPVGVQRIIYGAVDSARILRGSPLLDEAGKIAGIMWQPAAGLALPIDLLRQSMNRVTSGTREENVLADLGLGIDYAFGRFGTQGELRFGAQVTSVSPDGLAGQAGLARGDVIVAVGDVDLDFRTSVLQALQAERPFDLEIWRQARELKVTVGP